MNIDNKFLNGSHWVGLSISANKKVVYFDPLGLDIIPSEIKKYLMKQKLFEYEYSVVPIQSFDSKLCGYFVICFLLSQSLNISLNVFIKMFIDNGGVRNELKITKIFNQLFNMYVNKL